MDPVKSARRTFEVLELFGRERRALALKDVMAMLGYPASSASQLLKSLLALGYLDFDRERRTYFPTLRLAALGSWIPDALFGAGALNTVLERLRSATGETVILAAQSDLEVLYVHILRSEEPLQFSVPEGARRPLAASGLGWCLLSPRPDAEIEQLRRRINASGRSAVPIEPEELALRIAEVRTQGYAFSRHSVSAGAGVIGVPLPRGTHDRSLALGVAGPVARLEAKEALIVAELRQALDRLSDPHALS